MKKPFARNFAHLLCAVACSGAGLFLSGSVAAQPASPTLMRYPNASASAVAFVAHGELWTVPLAGGVAKSFTHDPGDVIAPHYSPDGRWIAFTWRRAKGRDVYVLPSSGGEPRRLTFDGPGQAEDGLVVGWTPDSTRIVFLSSRASAASGLVRAYSVPLGGGLAEPLPLDRAGLLSFSPDGKSVAYNRIFINYELRKRYVGGRAQDIYTYNFDAKRLTRLTDWKGTDTAPMWFGHTIYFLSDRGPNFRANIWAYDLDTKRTHQVTHFSNFDIDFPSLGGTTITFQQGGALYAIDLPSERLREIPIQVPDDGARTAPRTVAVDKAVRIKDALGGIDYALSPDGQDLLLSARGDLFRVPGTGSPTDLTATPSIDEDHPAWSSDGQTIAYTTDVNGEQQIAVRPLAGGAERLLTQWKVGYFYSPIWSPRGDALAVADANHGLWLVPVNGSGPQLIARDIYAEIRDASFSPDGRWLAYSTQLPTRQRAIRLHDLATGRDTVVSSPLESDRDPVFTPDGRLLAFVSQRNEQPFVSDRDDESLVSTLNSDGIYAATLSRPAPSPLVPSKGQIAKSAKVQIDLEGLMSRAVALPVTPTVITSLEVRGDRLFYESEPPQLIGGDLAGQTGALHAFDLATLKDRVVIADFVTHSLSADGRRVAFRRNGVWRIAGTEAGAPESALDLSGLRAEVDPRREWAEMFENAWRLDRDVFFSRAMNGSDWQAVHEAYRHFVPLLGSQDDFLYLLGQMQGEIASSHTFIGRGTDFDTRPLVTTPLLGVDYALDRASARYRFVKIYAGDNSRPDLNAPLGAPGLNAHPGDYLLAIDGHELRAPASPASVLDGLTGPLTLTIASSPAGARREVTVQPVDDELPLRRMDWVALNRATVSRLSGGRLGYIYLQDFDDQGSRDFVRQFYPQVDKAGLIIDVRWNLGGFTSQAVLDVLRRQRAGVFVNREGAVASLPTAVAPHAMVTLMNYGSMSDGDQFPYFFRAFKLGPLVGSRTWGGVQGLNGPWRLMDGSFLTIPKDSLADTHGHWVIENEGVAPDIAIEDAPNEMQTGSDAQLNAAVAAGLAQLKLHPMAPLTAPPPLPAYPAAGNVPGARFGTPPKD